MSAWRRPTDLETTDACLSRLLREVERRSSHLGQTLKEQLIEALSALCPEVQL